MSKQVYVIDYSNDDSVREGIVRAWIASYGLEETDSAIEYVLGAFAGVETPFLITALSECDMTRDIRSEVANCWNNCAECPGCYLYDVALQGHYIVLPH